MKASLFSFVAAAALFVATVASAAPFDHDRDLRRMSPRERARYEQSQRERARFEQAPRARARQQDIERARWEAQHRYDRGPARPYGHR
jgi:Ni/Co efflux regulator RcnB